MLYPKNQENALSDELFLNPTSEYRGAPFWAWNTRLESGKLMRQIDMMKKMGMGGFHMHVRTGMDSPYLDHEYMNFIRECTEKAKKEHMLAWLYDEDRWPSGSAGGKVTAGKPENARKSLLFTVHPYTPDRPHRNTRPEPGRGQRSMRQDNGVLLAVYDILLNDDGSLRAFRRIGEDEPAEGTKWYAYMEYATEDPWFNNQPYVDTLNPDAIHDFIQITHEAYLKAVGDEFGRTVPAIFTDEPKFTPKGTLAFAKEQRDLFLPWTTRLPELYEARYHQDLFDVLPELFWELPDGKLSLIRYRFHNLVADQFVASYSGQIGDWCKKHGIYLTGHVMGEESLLHQTQAVGDAMRIYPSFGIPGIDMLCDFHEYTTAKQTQSIVHQIGAPAMLSELYGVTGWDYDFRGYKLQGDWQAALGVTVRVPHLTWMTMKGEAKRDYPASIAYQSPWWDQFSAVENHFARVNTAMTRGKSVVKVAVIHPIESYWLYWGPSEQTAALRNQLEDGFQNLARTLLFGKIDFDYICEARLPELCAAGSNPLQVGEMAYDAVIVCQNRTLRSTTLERLAAFHDQGGRLIFVGDAPDYVDALPSSAPRALYDRSLHVSLESSSILNALEPCRLLDIRHEGGERDDRIIYQFRQDQDCRWLFLANGRNPVCPDVDDAGRIRIILKGEYALTEYNSLTGEIHPLPARYSDGNTILERQWYIHESLLLKLVPGRLEGKKPEPAENETPDQLFGTVEAVLEEPNMLLLDMAEYSFNGSPYQPLDELLRIDNYVRRQLDIPVRRKEVVQPYLLAPEDPQDRLTLRFTIPSEIHTTPLHLGLEDAEHTQVHLNGVPISGETDGWFVDEDIRTLPLPALDIGENILEVTVPIGRRTNLENFYLLGDFGVRVNGTLKTITAPVRRLGFGDIVSQGLPFYTGNLLYKFQVQTTKPGLTIRAPRYCGGLIKVFVDGVDRGNIIYSPYTLHLPEIEAGTHEVTLRLYGTRYNGFAQLHHVQGVYFYQSPNSWRSEGDLWCYEYQFKPAGILKSPEIYNGGHFIQPNGSIREVRAQAHISDRS